MALSRRVLVQPPRVVLSAVIGLIVAAAVPASAQTTALYIDNRPGGLFSDALEELITAGEATFTLPNNGTSNNTVWVRVSTNSWDLRFAAAGDARLEPRMYLAATREPFSLFNALDVNGHGRGCNRLSGRFLVREIVYGGNVIQRLAIDFEHHCSDGGPALFGALRYNSTIASMTPFDGNYPEYRLDLIPPTNGRIVGTTLDCGNGSMACSDTFGEPTAVPLTAVADPGYVFAGWSGNCHGSLTITANVNSVEECAARFAPIVPAAPVRMAVVNSGQGEFVGAGRRDILDANNATWTAESIEFLNVIRGIVVRTVRAGDDGDVSWTFQVEGPSAQNIAPGTYTIGTGGAIRISSDSRGCSVPYGSFTLHELELVNEVVLRASFDLDAHCSGASIPPVQLQASVRYNSSHPIAPSLALKVPGGRGRVDLSVGASCTVNCMQPFEAGSVVTMTPVALAGHHFTRWQGDAGCEDGTVVMAGPLFCEAVLDKDVTADAITPSSGTGVSQAFTLDYSSTAGASDIATAWLWFTSSGTTSPANSCRLYVERATATVFLLNDAGTAWSSAALGAPIVLQNSRCAIDAADSSMAVVGNNTLRVRASVRFLPVSFGFRVVNLQAISVTGVTTDWQQRGTWTIPTPRLGADAVAPGSGAGAQQTFTFTYTNAFGTQDIRTAWAWFTTNVFASAARTCLLYLDRQANTVHLVDDVGQTWKSTPLGSTSVLENGQCALSATSITGDFTTLNLHVTMGFTSSFAGTKLVYLFANSGPSSTGWLQRGSWTVPAMPHTSATATPSNVATASGTITLAYASASGTSLGTVWVWFNATLAASAANSCLLHYAPTSGIVYLLNDAGDTWMPATPGSPTFLQNRQCGIALRGTTTTTTPSTVTLTLEMFFKPQFAGSKQIFLFASDILGRSAGWQDHGDWTVPSTPVPSIDAESVSPSSGAGSIQTFALRYAASLSAAELTSTWVWFNGSLASSAASSCLIYLEPLTARLHLLNDDGGAWLSATLGTNVTLQNRQCAVDVGTTTVELADRLLTLNLALAFKPAFAGAQNVYLYAAGGIDATGWQPRGTWTIPPVVSADSVTPSSGSGASQAFTLTYSSINGASAVTSAWVWFNTTLAASSAASCLVYYDAATDTVNLVNDAATAWLTASLGSATPLQNSQCAIGPAGSQVIKSGNMLTLVLDVTFLPPFTGPKNVYLYANALDATASTGWHDRGDWTP